MAVPLGCLWAASVHKTHDLLGVSQQQHTDVCRALNPPPARTDARVHTTPFRPYGFQDAWSHPDPSMHPATHTPAPPHCHSNIIRRYQFQFVAASDAGLFEPDVLQARKVRGMGQGRRGVDGWSRSSCCRSTVSFARAACRVLGKRALSVGWTATSCPSPGPTPPPPLTPRTQDKEAASRRSWLRTSAGLSSLRQLHAWLHATHLCYAVGRQTEFGVQTITDPKLLASY